MCELLGLSARFPATLQLSLDEFTRHGGETGHHRDGWGVVFYDRDDVRSYRDVDSASTSPLIRFVETHPHRATTTIAHIRFATRGERALCNTQPFCRELGGVMHTFAHNGDLPDLLIDESVALGFHRPVGATDSEIAFCMLLGSMERVWLVGGVPRRPSLDERMAVFASFCERIRSLGPANFLYADGEYLFAHANRRKQPDGSFSPPGLHLLERRCAVRTTVEGGGTRIDSTTPEQQVQLVASVPLTGEAWQSLPSGTVLAMHDGAVVRRV